MNSDNITSLSKLKPGDCFRFLGCTKVYVYQGQSKGEYGYYDYNPNDISNFHYTKSDLPVEIGFTF